MPVPNLRHFESLAAACRAAAEEFAIRAAEAIRARGRFAVVLAGGNTPRPMYEGLAQPPWRDTVAWEQVEFFWGDERTVPPEDAASNYRLAWDSLLSRVPADRRRIHRLPGEAADLERAAADYEAEIAAALGARRPGPLPVFDMVLLGLGDDGHTASLFPHTAALREDQRWVVANPVPHLQTTRLTMTWPIINAARDVVFLVGGQSKARALADVLAGPRDPERWPAQAVQPSAGRLLWFVDRQAAQHLR